MPTQATAFAETTRFTRNPGELSTRVLALYRRFIRSAPEFAETYELSIPSAQIRTKLRQEFERHRFVEDVNVRNVLLAKGQMEFQETINFWKQQPHVYRYFSHDQEPHVKTQPNSFMHKFLQGR